MARTKYRTTKISEIDKTGTSTTARTNSMVVGMVYVAVAILERGPAKRKTQKPNSPTSATSSGSKNIVATGAHIPAMYIVRVILPQNRSRVDRLTSSIFRAA
jgi:hypothetical protein